MATIPTSMRGYVDDAAAYGGILSDFSDTVPATTWPESTETYRQMRRHPQLAAIEKAWTLPIRRATWTLNPAGCRPEVVQLVADDLGLPIAGKDEPKAARTRGVSWSDHLRLALLSLPYGFSAFEQMAELRDGKARLVELSERLPSTVNEFHTDRVGRLTGITQVGLIGQKQPQIKADRLQLYSREREGAAYWGTSILRPAYSGFLLSRELLRVLAISNRRFGMGVPVLRPLPGTQPTQEQEAAAARIAQEARVGETGGAAIPPGFVMELIGQSGGTPDTLGFLRYLDHTMATSCLSMFLDLGTTASGSRALAGEFVDLYLLAIQGEALAIADASTRQTVARIVEWNWGLDEPVPAIQVSDVGTKHEITAEALNLLLNSGALSADPGLEAQVRRMYRLPEREQSESAPTGRIFESDIATGTISRNERRAMFNLPPVEGGDEFPDQEQPPEPASAQRKRKAKPQADGQLELDVAASTSPPAVGVARRDRPTGRVSAEAAAEGSARLRRHEAAAGDDDGSQEAWAAAVAGLLAAWPALAAPLVDDLVAQAEAVVDSGDVAGLGTLAASVASVDALAATLAEAMTGLATTAAQQVVASAAAQGVTVDEPEQDQAPIAGLAAATAAWIASGYATAAARRAVLAPAGQVAAVVRAALTDMSTAERGMVADHIGAALSTAQGQGRLAVLAANPARGYRADESNDRAACAVCRAADNRVYPTLAAALVDYPNGVQNARCEGGARCRGALEPIWT